MLQGSLVKDQISALITHNLLVPRRSRQKPHTQSPLAPGQWKPFLAVYAGFYIFNNIIQPIRVGLSIGLARYIDKAVAFFQDKFKVNKGVAIGITFFFTNVVGTLTAMSGGIVLASIASGVPIWA
jgi:hypothetical protein